MTDLKNKTIIKEKISLTIDWHLYKLSTYKLLLEPYRIKFLALNLIFFI